MQHNFFKKGVIFWRNCKKLLWGAFDHFLGKGDELYQKWIYLSLSGISYECFIIKQIFRKKQYFWKKLWKTIWLIKTVQHLKMIGAPEFPPEECKFLRILKLPEVQHSEVKISAPLTSLITRTRSWEMGSVNASRLLTQPFPSKMKGKN